ncbi:MAG: hypothetical protein ACSLEH_00545 [Candidatus Carsonella ruddii]
MLNKKIVSCGLTGIFGYFHTNISIKFGTKFVCGINYKKKGSISLHLPVFSSSLKSIKITKCKISILFIPNFFCKKIIIENIYSGLKIIICISENISLNDLISIKFYCNKYNIIFFGPNSPGLILPFYKIRIGIFPLKYIKNGLLIILSRSGTLTYEAIKISNKKIGQYLCIGFGGDFIIILNIKKIFPLLVNYKKNVVLLIGEIGGILEIVISKFKKKKIFFFISGIFSPSKKTMGHAGAVNTKQNDILKKIKKIKKNCILFNSLNNINLLI